ncbi:MAG: acid-activated urea channel [Defluviitaleaceae bacterium]|nr:acid-activated urea channel [Defluviitaleaceae bacterium]
MGMLGLSLLFVGIVLVANGVNRFTGVDPKSTAALNLITGFVIVSGNLIMLSKAGSVQDFQNVASGFLFGFTYLFVASNYLFKLDLRPFGWFSGFVAVYATVMAVNSYGFDVRLTLLWGAWALLWLEGFLELVVGLKISKIFPYLSIAEGVFAAFIPAVIMLLDKW